ncbi:hypothetical protein E2C01_019556 [Portunus trituberculatus]|uniref:Uncharacterized protein n=1 Tax=Portunus trituberculatus TaxID=210409 RepID=A0A5B7DZA6_PORTR|nr:hypothetical protein [Portunus trituberculatus]
MRRKGKNGHRHKLSIKFHAARGRERLSQCSVSCFATNITLLETHAPLTKPVSSSKGRANVALPCGLPPLFWSQGRLPGGAPLAMQEEDGPIHPLGKQIHRVFNDNQREVFYNSRQNPECGECVQQLPGPPQAPQPLASAPGEGQVWGRLPL